MEKLHASMIIEILGKPKAHVQEAMETIVTRLDAEKGIKILNKQIHPPKEIEKSNLFTTFAELDTELDTLENYFGILFAYMPSHIEITHPERLALNNSELNALGNTIIQRLHNYDAIAKKMINENRILMQKLKEASPELYNQEVKILENKKETKKKIRKKKSLRKKKV